VYCFKPIDLPVVAPAKKCITDVSDVHTWNFNGFKTRLKNERM